MRLTARDIAQLHDNAEFEIAKLRMLVVPVHLGLRLTTGGLLFLTSTASTSCDLTAVIRIGDPDVCVVTIHTKTFGDASRHNAVSITKHIPAYNQRIHIYIYINIYTL